MVYGTYNHSYILGFINQVITRGAHIVGKNWVNQNDLTGIMAAKG